MDPVGATFNLFTLGLKLYELIESKRKNREDLITLSKELVNNLEQIEQLRQGQIKDAIPEVDDILFTLQIDLEQVYIECERLFEKSPGFSGKMKSVFKFIDPDGLQVDIARLNEAADKAYRKLLTNLSVQHSVSLANTNVELRQRDEVYMDTVLRLEKLILGQSISPETEAQDTVVSAEILTSAMAQMSLFEAGEMDPDSQMDTVYLSYKVRSLSRALPDSRLLVAPHTLPPQIDTAKVSALTYHMKTGDAALDRQEAIKETLDLLTILKDPQSDIPAFIWYHRASMLTIILLELGLVKAALDLGQLCLHLIRHMASTNPIAFQYFLSLTLNNLSNQLYHTGKYQKALECAQEALAIRRNDVVETYALSFKVDLAIVLNTYSNRLSDMGRDHLALETCLESYQIRKGLAEQFPWVFKPDLAVVLNCLSNRYTDAGKYQDSFEAIKEAVDIDREFAAKCPERFSARLAFTLRNFQATLSRQGQTEEALSVIKESVSIYRTLHKDRTDAYAPMLVNALVSLSHVYVEAGQDKDAFATIVEAVELSRHLSEVNLHGAQLHLASSLHSHSTLLTKSGKHQEALIAIQEAVEIRRQLGESNPQVIRPDLASSLTQLANCFSFVEQHDAALESMIEAVDVFFRLSEERPTVFQPRYATSLIVLAIKQSAVDGNDTSALETVEIAVDLLRTFSFDRPSSDFQEQLASALMDLSRRHGRLEHHQASVDTCQEAVAIYDQLYKQQPDKYGLSLAKLLLNFSQVLLDAKQHLAAQGAIRQAISTMKAVGEFTDQSKVDSVNLIKAQLSLATQLLVLGQYVDATEVCQEAVALSRQKASEDNEKYEPILANALLTLGTIFQRSADHNAALVSSRESVNIYRRLSEEKPADLKLKSALVLALDEFCTVLGSVGQEQMALPTSALAVRFGRELVEGDVVSHRKTLANSLLTHAMYLSRSGRYQAALDATEEAVGIIRVLYTENAKLHELELSRALSNLAIELIRVGREREALQVNQEAVSLIRRLTLEKPALLEELATVLMTLFSNLYRDGQQYAALEAIEEAVQIVRQLTQQRPEKHTALLSSALTNLSSQLTEVGRYEAALGAADEAIGIRRHLVADLPQVYEPVLATTLFSKAMILTRLTRYSEARPCIVETIQLYQRHVHVNPTDIMQKLAVATQLLQGLQGVA